MLHLEVSRQKRQNTNPSPDGKFFVDLNGLGILRDGTHDVTFKSQTVPPFPITMKVYVIVYTVVLLFGGKLTEVHHNNLTRIYFFVSIL